MPLLDPASLGPGSRLPMPLYNRLGVKLLGEGVVLTDAICTRISRSTWGDLFLANTPAEVAAAVALIESEGIAPGAYAEPARGPEPSDAEVNEAPPEAPEAPVKPAVAEVVEPAMPLEMIEARPEASIYAASDVFEQPLIVPPSREEVRRRAARFKNSDAHVASLQRLWAGIPLRIRSQRAAHRPATGDLEGLWEWPDASRVIALRRDRTLRLRAVLAGMLAGSEVALRDVAELAEEMHRWHAAHPQRFAQLALLPGRRDEDLPEQCYAAGALAMATAARLGWPEADQRLAALAGMLADVGMAAVPQELRNNARALNEIEINRVRRHPALGVVMLDSVRGLPEEVRRAAFEHHERDNGSGYPRGLRGPDIADLSKVASVATLFAAMTSRRKYRLTKRPYDALEDLIMLASSGALDRRVVRALVQAVGLFPVGSWVMLSTGQAAQVVAADPEQLDRPAVRITGERTMTIWLGGLDRGDMSVVEPIDAPGERLSD
jgi:HD-GYP domain-containing protein (c-di-GMP phosphodiesterase class II)